MSDDKPYRIRVRALDGQRREANKIKGRIAPHVDVFDARDGVEFIVAASKEAHLASVRAKLAAAGLEEMPNGDTQRPVPRPEPAGGRRSDRPAKPHAPAPHASEPLKNKPYAFVPLPADLTASPPVWHDGTGTKGRVSGELRCEIETLTPLLVGWQRQAVREFDEPDDLWKMPYDVVTDRRGDDKWIDVQLGGTTVQTVENKSVLYPLRAPWEKRPVLLPSDSLKGLLRHELGALLGAPMERVAERSYSYRPNLRYPEKTDGRYLEPRLARVKSTMTISAADENWPFPELVDVLRMATRNDQKYYPSRERDARGRLNRIPPPPDCEPYKGGLGGGQALPPAVLSNDAQRRLVHTGITILRLDEERKGESVPAEVQAGYARTLNHLLKPDGHFSSRHQNVGTNREVQEQAISAVRKAARNAFQPGDVILVEWDTRKKRIVSLGWHYYYRWAYADTVRVRLHGWTRNRHGLFPLEVEKQCDDEGAPKQLSAVRRLFGYTGDNTGDNAGSAGIGKGDYEQLMGRLSVNAAIEVIEPHDTQDTRFLKPTFLRELGMPRPSAVEHYLRQPYYPNQRPSDQAKLVTYGDAAGYDEPGELAGRKFYLDRAEAQTGARPGEPWKDDSEANRRNERSTLALEASCPNRRFRFTLRFRDLDPGELAAVLVALSPDQFKAVLGGTRPAGYCSKLGYARPLGWGSVRITAKALSLLDTANDRPELRPVDDLTAWVREHFERPPMLEPWLAVHQRSHPAAGDYPRKDNEIHTYHTDLRANHSRLRRYRGR